MSVSIRHSEIPHDIKLFSQGRKFDFALTAPTENTVWNFRSLFLKDVLLDVHNDNAVVSFGPTHFLNVNEAIDNSILISVDSDLSQSRIIEQSEIFVLSRYKSQTILREAGKHWNEDLPFDADAFPKLNALLNRSSELYYSIWLQKQGDRIGVLAILDHFGRCIRTPKETESWCRDYEVPMAISQQQINTWNLVYKSCDLYSKKYYIHQGNRLMKMSDNWFGLTTGLIGGVTLDKLLDCWLAYKPVNLESFEKRILSIVKNNDENKFLLIKIRAAFKMLNTSLAVIQAKLDEAASNSSKQHEIVCKVPSYLRYLTFGMIRKSLAPTKLELKQAYKEVIRALFTDKSVDSPKLLEYSA